MGAFLDHPKTEKHNDTGEGANNGIPYRYGLSYMQGWRIDMEDAHCVVVRIPGFSEWSFFAVFDGHAGSKVASHSAEHILKSILDTEEFIQLKQRNNPLEPFSENERKLVESGITNAFLKLDRTMHELFGEASDERERSGTTAVMAILTPNEVIFANLGDSRALLKSKNSLFSTVDHKPYLENERKRIVKAGGSVMIQRVNGSLAVSRAFGDFEYKAVSDLAQNEQLVSPEPDVTILLRNKEEDEFMVLACDGIYDVLENEELCSIIRSRLAVTRDLDTATNQILDACLSKGSRDNMTMILIVFDAAPQIDPAKVEEEQQWREKVQDKVQKFLVRKDPKTSEAVDAELVFNHLKDKDLEDSQPGRLHLARGLVDELLVKWGAQDPQQPNSWLGPNTTISSSNHNFDKNYFDDVNH